VPAPAVALLTALEAGDLDAARATLADDVMIADSRIGGGEQSTIASLSEYARGCTRTDLRWDYNSYEPEKAAVSLIWGCPSHAPSMVFIWTDGARVVWVQFGLPRQDASE
jgi:hypothetical protein